MSTKVYRKSRSCDVWFLRYEARQTEFFVILGHFLPLYPTNNPKNQNFEKLKKAPEDIIILHKCIKNHDHMLYWSWDMVRDGCNCYFSFWAIFCYFTTLTGRKINIWKKKEKTPEDIIILHMGTKNYDQMIYGSWDMVCDRRMDRWMDRWMEEVIYRGGYPN